MVSEGQPLLYTFLLGDLGELYMSLPDHIIHYQVFVVAKKLYVFQGILVIKFDLLVPDWVLTSIFADVRFSSLVLVFNHKEGVHGAEHLRVPK